MRCPRLDALRPAPEGRTGWPWTEESAPLPDVMPDGRPWPRISIVTPVYNQAAYLEEAIRSVLLQGYPDLEYMVVNDGSTDPRVEAIIRRYAPWLSWWVTQPNRGQSAAINRGFRRATGAIVGWLNSDDRLAPDALARFAQAFAANPEADLVYGDVETGWDDRAHSIRRGRPVAFEEMLAELRVPIPQPASLWKRSVLDRVGYLNPRWHAVMDRDFYVRAARSCRLLYIPEVLGFTRLHRECKSVARKDLWRREIPLMYRELLRSKDLPPRIRALERQTMCSAHLHCSRMAEDQGTRWRHLVQAVAWWPPILLQERLENSLHRHGRLFVRGLRALWYKGRSILAPGKQQNG